MMKWILGLLEFLEFLTTPFGFAGMLWIGLYVFLLQMLGLDALWASLLPVLPAADLYFLLKQFGY